MHDVRNGILLVFTSDKHRPIDNKSKNSRLIVLKRISVLFHSNCTRNSVRALIMLKFHRF